MTARPVTTTDLWKLVGLLLVLIDHWGLLFADDPSWRVVGRAAAPIFFFFIGLARTRQVPWSWVILGLGLTAVESWTSGTGLGKINLNILINFAYVRLLLPEVEQRVMPHPWGWRRGCAAWPSSTIRNRRCAGQAARFTSSPSKPTRRACGHARAV